MSEGLGARITCFTADQLLLYFEDTNQRPILENIVVCNYIHRFNWRTAEWQRNGKFFIFTEAEDSSENLVNVATRKMKVC